MNKELKDKIFVLLFAVMFGSLALCSMVAGMASILAGGGIFGMGVVASGLFVLGLVLVLSIWMFSMI